MGPLQKKDGTFRVLTVLFDLTKLDTDDALYEVYKHTTFLQRTLDQGKPTWKQRLIVTFSLKYRDYQREIRRCQLETCPEACFKKNPQKNRQMSFK